MKEPEKKEILQKKQMILLKLTEALQKENAGFWLEAVQIILPAVWHPAPPPGRWALYIFSPFPQRASGSGRREGI